MNDMREALDHITEPGIMLIVRLPSAEGLDDVAEAAVRGGARALEVTTNTPGGLVWLRSARDRFDGRLVLGAGTVLDEVQAEEAVAAGARFLVAPDFNPDVVAVARRAGCLAIPGALTPSEITTAWRAGADLVKLFPANSGGPKYLADVVAPLDRIRLLPTGGIDESNAAEYVQAGAAAVSVGASVINSQTVVEGRFDEMAARIRAIVNNIAEARGVAAPVSVTA